jgi:hypothetical protein
MRPTQPNRRRRLIRRRGLFLATTTIALGGLTAGGALAATTGSRSHRQPPRPPVAVTVNSPGISDVSGSAGVGFIVDLQLDAIAARDNHLLSAAAGYVPFFNDPSSTTFHPGPDMGAPGLVVLLSSTPNMPGTPFQGPRTNLAGLFQINGVDKVDGKAETWNTWQPGKALFGTGRRTLTVFVVRGTAPAVLPGKPTGVISNIARVPFTIAP